MYGVVCGPKSYLLLLLQTPRLLFFVFAYVLPQMTILSALKQCNLDTLFRCPWPELSQRIHGLSL